MDFLILKPIKWQTPSLSFCERSRMTSTHSRILYLLCFYKSIWIVLTECGYYNEIPTDVCSYKSIEYISGISSSFICQYHINNNSWYILQNIFDNSICSGDPINQIKHQCNTKDCHCSETSSGFDCDAAIIRTEDFDFNRKKCDPRFYTESLIVTNQCINKHKQYLCHDDKLILKPCNISNYDESNNLKRPSLLSSTTDDMEYDHCASIKCVDSINNDGIQKKEISLIQKQQACLPVDVCQNSYDNLYGNTSWKYHCDEYEIKTKYFYHNHECRDYELDEIMNENEFEYQKDIIICNDVGRNNTELSSSSCDEYLKIKEYDVSNEIGCDEEYKNEYDYKEFIFGLGCHSFWIDNDTKHSIKRSCTNSSYSVEKYLNGHCGGKQYGGYTVNDGCDIVDIQLFDKNYSYLSLIEIVKCGLIEDNGNIKDFEMLNIMKQICFIFLFLLLFMY